MEKEIYDIKLDPQKALENEEHGINMIAVTSDPAIRVKGLYFNNKKEKDKELKVLNEQQFNAIMTGLEGKGIELKNLTAITQEQYMMGMLNLGFNTEWQLDSSLDRIAPDGKGVFMVRYRYGTPPGVPGTIETTRTFCRDMMATQRVYSLEEINSLSNPEFGNYSIFEFKGSYGCRHRWNREYYYADFDSDVIRQVGSNPTSRQAAESVDQDATKVNPKPKRNKFSFKEDVYKMRVAAPAMIPDIEIPRKDPDTGDIFYVTFSAEEIEQLWTNFQGKKINNRFNVEHTEEEAPAYILESWIIENQEDKAYSKYGFSQKEVPIGSVMVVTQFTDLEFFMDNVVESGQYGYSVEGFFEIDLKLNDKMKEEIKDKAQEEVQEEVQKFELDGKFYTIVDGKLQLMEEEEEKKEEEVEEKVEAMDEKKEEEEVKAEEETTDNNNYVTVEMLEEKLEAIVEMIAAKEEEKEAQEEEQDEEMNKEEFKQEEAEQTDDSIVGRFRALHKLYNN